MIGERMRVTREQIVIAGTRLGTPGRRLVLATAGSLAVCNLARGEVLRTVQAGVGVEALSFF